MGLSLLLALLAAGAPLLARGSEDWLGLAPCELCLWQRWPYWVAAGLALLAAAIPAARRPLVMLAGIAVLGSGAIAVFHVGVEQHWWPSPLPGCQAPRSGGPSATLDDMMARLAPAPTKPCDAPNYLIPGLPVSIPVFNLLYALGLGGFALTWAARQRKAP
jgi:disulfide bond formation protein DsbB